MDEATRKMIAEEFMIWGWFLMSCFFSWQWAYYVANRTLAKKSTFPRLAKFFLWFFGIVVLYFVVVYGLISCVLHPWMRIIVVLNYLAALGYIIKRRSEIQPPKLPTSK